MFETFAYMLLILKVFDASSVQVSLDRHPVLYETEDECYTAAGAVIDDVARQAGEERDSFRHWCLRVPAAQEYDRMFERRSERVLVEP